MKARTMSGRQSLPAHRSLLDRILDDLGQPPRPSWRDFAVFLLVLFVFLAMTFVGYQP